MKGTLILVLLASFLICLLFELKSVRKNMRIDETEKEINMLKRTNAIRIVEICILVLVIFLKPSVIITILSIFNIVELIDRLLGTRRLIKLLVEREELNKYNRKF